MSGLRESAPRPNGSIPSASGARLARPQDRGEGIDVDAAREGIAMTEEHRRAKVVVCVVSGVGPCEGTECFGIDPVVNVGPVEADQANFPASLDRDLAVGLRRTGDVYPFFRGLRALDRPTLGEQGQRPPDQGRHDDRAS